MGDYSNAPSFGEAFKTAHKAGGSGHTFKYNDKLYITDCADGGNYGKNSDSYRTALEHA